MPKSQTRQMRRADQPKRDKLIYGSYQLGALRVHLAKAWKLTPPRITQILKKEREADWRVRQIKKVFADLD